MTFASSINWGQIGSTALQAYSAYSKANIEKSVAQNNMQYVEWQAKSIIQHGAEAEQRQRMKTASLKGSQRAAMAAAGLSLTEGSPLEILTSTDVMGEQDALRIRQNAKQEAWATRAQGAGYAAKAASTNPTSAAAMSLLTNADSLSSAWDSFRKWKES